MAESCAVGAYQTAGVAGRGGAEKSDGNEVVVGAAGVGVGVAFAVGVAVSVAGFDGSVA